MIDKQIAFEQMMNVLKIGIKRYSCMKAIGLARNDGLVTTTLAFHRGLIDVESELKTAIKICDRTAGKDNTQKVMQCLGISIQGGLNDGR
jgi:hypothetical protein